MSTPAPTTLTLRQEIIETAARHLSREMSGEVRSVDLAAWLESSRAARGIAVARGIRHEDLQTEVDQLSWSRLVAAVNREVAAYRRATSWGFR
jgi:hypothetical protein